MRSVIRAVLLISGFLLIPILPLIVLGTSFEADVTRLLERNLSFGERFWLLAGVLATDIFLPIPSSAVSTYGGGILGTWPAAAASWLGMTAGACGGFGLARLLGEPFVKRMARGSDLEQLQRVSRRFGPLVIVLTRALPILAEAAVLLVGATKLSWKRFLLPVLVSNLAISVCYAAVGEYFQGMNALPLAVVASGTVPLLAALLVRRRLPKIGLENGGSSV